MQAADNCILGKGTFSMSVLGRLTSRVKKLFRSAEKRQMFPICRCAAKSATEVLETLLLEAIAGSFFLVYHIT